MILYYMRVYRYMSDDVDGSAYYVHKDRLGYTLARSSEKRLTDVPISEDEEKKNRHERCLGICSSPRSSTVDCLHTRAHTTRVVRTYYITASSRG